MRRLKLYCCLGILLCFSGLSFAGQEGSLKIDKDQWENTVDGLDYTETYKEAEPDPPKETNLNPSIPSLNLGGLKYVFYFIVVGLVLFLIVKILSNLNRNPNIKKQDISIESIEEIEEKIHEIDLDLLLKEALESKLYHIGLRINFLIIIKLLSENGSISWAKEKTNWEYYDEVKDVLLKDGFKTIIIAFEPVWYGEHELTEEGFFQLQPIFDNYKKQLLDNE